MCGMASCNFSHIFYGRTKFLFHHGADLEPV